MKRSERVYRWLLRLYPRDFRDEYGQEMSLLFRDRQSEGTGRLWLQVEVMGNQHCTEPAPAIVKARGWVSAYDASGAPTVWFSSRGC